MSHDLAPDSIVHTAAIVTPTFAGDLERTTLLVESYRRTGTELPLVLVVQTEDRHLFAGMARGGVEVLTTADVLPPDAERRRCNRYRRRDPRRYLLGKPMHGWTSQQLVKLAAPSVLGVDVTFCVDSDVALLAPLLLDHGRTPDGAPVLFESHDDNALTLSWALNSMRAFGVNLHGALLRQYVHQGVALHRATCERLQNALESRTGVPWWREFVDEGLAEYPTYGVFARNVDVASPVVAAPPLDILTYWVEPEVDLLDDLRAQLRTRRPLGVCVQSALAVDPQAYREILEPLWP